MRQAATRRPKHSHYDLLALKWRRKHSHTSSRLVHIHQTRSSRVQVSLGVLVLETGSETCGLLVSLKLLHSPLEWFLWPLTSLIVAPFPLKTHSSQCVDVRCGRKLKLHTWIGWLGNQTSKITGVSNQVPSMFALCSSAVSVVVHNHTALTLF